MSYKRHVLIRMYHKHQRALQWICCDAIPATVTLAIFCAGCIAVMLTIGETPSGPAADLSTCQVSSFYSVTYKHDDPGPGITLASRAGQDMYEVQR